MLNFVLYLYQLLFEDHKIIDLRDIRSDGIMERNKMFSQNKVKQK